VIRYDDGVAGIDVRQLEGFFDGWPTPPTAATLFRVLINSTHVVLARDGDDIVGFVNVLSDGELSAYLPLLEVRASHRGRGIGSELVRRALELVSHVYERLGAARLSGMAWRNRSAESLDDVR
jgi:ribosomal protein S18 acetylase RimI-like enzyme